MDPMQSDVTSNVDNNIIKHINSKWFSMKKRIDGLVNKVTISNVQIIAREIMNLNLIPGRGLFCQAIMKSQMRSPKSSNVYAALVAIINSEFPDVGLLLVKRVVLQFKEAYESKNKKQMEASSMFIAHLVNQTVVYEVLALDVLLLLLGNPSSDNVYVAVQFCIQCGSLLLSYSPGKTREVFKEFNRVLSKGAVEKRVQVWILNLFAVKRSNFRSYPRIIDELDLVEADDQVSHVVSLLHDIDPETCLDDFKEDLDFDELPCEGFGMLRLDEDN